MLRSSDAIGSRFLFRGTSVCPPWEQRDLRLKQTYAHGQIMPGLTEKESDSVGFSLRYSLGISVHLPHLTVILVLAKQKCPILDICQMHCSMLAVEFKCRTELPVVLPLPCGGQSFRGRVLPRFTVFKLNSVTSFP